MGAFSFHGLAVNSTIILKNATENPAVCIGARRLILQ